MFFFKVKFYIYELEREKSLLHNIVGRIKSDSALKTQHACHVLARLACFASCCRAAVITWWGFDEALKGAQAGMERRIPHENSPKLQDTARDPR